MKSRYQYTKPSFLQIALLILVGTSLLFSAGKSEHSSQITFPETANVGNIVPGVAVVKFKPRTTIKGLPAKTGIESVDHLFQLARVSRIEPILKANTDDRKAVSGMDRVYLIHLSGSPKTVIDLLKNDENIEYIEPLYFHKLYEVPNDSLFSQQAFLNVIQAPSAWDVVKGEQGDVTVAVVDGGTDIRHPDINENLWVNPGEVADNGVDDDHNGYIDDVHGWNFADSTNDPTGLEIAPFNANHGTHTAGTACAVTNNLIGVAGVSWNARLMAINAGSASGDSSIAWGYLGIFYAAKNGASVISCSWGRLGAPSAFEQDVINYATSLGAVVVAAAGNDDKSSFHYPSSYKNVLSVAATTNDDKKAYFSNYGRSVDVSAPGVGILSTINKGQYASYQGTSMACPVAAGVVALVKARHLDWTGFQAAQQVRVTCDNIDELNPTYAGQLGYGRINARRAVTEQRPSLRIADVQFIDENRDSVIQRGEKVQVVLTIKNYLATAQNIHLTLSENDEFAEVLNPNASLPMLGTMEEKVISTPFQVTFAANAPTGHPVNFDLEITADGYQDRDYFTLTVMPFFGTLDVNNIDMSVTNIGRIGFFDSNDPGSGIGFKYRNGPNLLFEGSMIAGTSAQRISNSARGLIVNSSQESDEDFEVAEDGDLQILRPGTISDEESIGIFNDSKADNPMHIRITQETFAMRKQPFDDFVLFRFSIENYGDETLSNFHFGIFLDWDMDGEHYSTNKAGYDATRRLGYAYDTNGGPSTYVGISLLTSGDISYRAIFNDPDDPNNPTWGLHDGYTDEEKWESISAGIQYTEAGPADISHVMGVGPFTIEPQNSIQIGFSLLAGENLNDLQTNADSARALWRKLFATGVERRPSDKMPLSYSLQQNYPNPFNPGTSISYSLAKADDVDLTIFNTLGQKVKTIVKMHQLAGYYSVMWDGKDELGHDMPAGTYFYRLKAGDFIRIRKMILLR